jgi:hypothetical protein
MIPTVRISSREVTALANRFIDKISSAVGTLYEPVHIKRMAKAQAYAKIIEANAKGMTKLQKRAVDRRMHEEERNQANMEAITTQAAKQLEHTAKPEELDDDWIIDFFGHARKVSDKHMQSLWAKILVGEANEPKSFAKVTLQTVRGSDPDRG